MKTRKAIPIYAEKKKTVAIARQAEYYKYYKENYMFKDISFKARQGGKNSINIAKITKIGINSIKSFYKFKREL